MNHKCESNCQPKKCAFTGIVVTFITITSLIAYWDVRSTAHHSLRHWLYSVSYNYVHVHLCIKFVYRQGWIKLVDWELHGSCHFQDFETAIRRDSQYLEKVVEGKRMETRATSIQDLIANPPASVVFISRQTLGYTTHDKREQGSYKRARIVDWLMNSR